MKKSFLFLVLAASFKFSAQTSIALSVQSTSAAIPASSTLSTTTVPLQKNTITVDVKNTSAVTHTYDVKRYDVVINMKGRGDSAVANFCFATLCTGKEVTLSLVPLILKAGESASTDTSADYNMLDADLIEASALGFSSVKYTVFESNNHNDSVQFTIKYNANLMLTGLKELSQNLSSFGVFPNPAKGNTTISFMSNKENTANIFVVNTIGQTVISKEVTLVSGKNSVPLDLQGLPSGVYFVQVKDGEINLSKKLIIE
ncbi:MAG: T9SS type A sorting domain-containing protein [bacterium]|nr:T9SS type A sorting domain-containing protein [bacterium]